MAAIMNRASLSSLARRLLRKAHRTGFDTQRPSEKLSQFPVQESALHTMGGSRGPLRRSKPGLHHNGRFLLVSAVPGRSNSSQVPVLAVSAPVPDTPTSAADPASSLLPVTTPIADHAPVSVQPITEQVAEAAPTALDVLQGAGQELSLSELGLGNYTPVGLIQNLLEFLHVDVGVPWWAAIVTGTILARCAMFPVIVMGQREAAKLNNVLPEMTRHSERLNEAKRSGNKFEFSKAYSDMTMFQKKHNVNPMKGFLVPLVQAPVFMSFFIGLRQMAYLPVPSMQSGGLWWFTDLTAADPIYILPVAVTVSMLAIVELGAESGVDNPNLRAMKTVFRVMPLIILPLTINFPTAVFTYWLTSNLFSLGQVALLKHPAIRQRLRIPERITHPPSALPPSPGFFKTIQTGWTNAKLAQQLEERERRIKNHLDIAAKGPLRQTFSNNPLQQTRGPRVAARQAGQSPAAPPVGGKKRPWEETIG